MSSYFARREGWRCSTNTSLPLGGAVAPKHTKRIMSPSRGSEIRLQTHRSSRGVHSVWGFESPTICMALASELELERQPIILFFLFFSSLQCRWRHCRWHRLMGQPLGRDLLHVVEKLSQVEKSLSVESIGVIILFLRLLYPKFIGPTRKQTFLKSVWPAAAVGPDSQIKLLAHLRLNWTSARLQWPCGACTHSEVWCVCRVAAIANLFVARFSTMCFEWICQVSATVLCCVGGACACACARVTTKKDS